MDVVCLRKCFVYKGDDALSALLIIFVLRNGHLECIAREFRTNGLLDHLERLSNG